MQREHGVQSGTGVCQESKTCPYDSYAGAFDFKSKTIPTDDVQYAYYADGSLKWDANKGITLIEYDKFGYPQKVSFNTGNTTEYTYTADGRKLQTIYKTAVPNITVALGEAITLTSANTLSVDTITYAGDFVIENGQLTKYLFDKGYFTFSNGQAVAHYYIQDHQGNIRAVVDGDNHVEQINHYYPFGAVYSDAGTNDALQRYKYNGKELDRMHGLNQYDYGARNYDPLLCRFTQIDAKCEEAYGRSPFSYCLNTPMNAIDPDGERTIFINGLIGGGSPEAGAPYWNMTDNSHRLSSFVQEALDYFKDDNYKFIVADYSWNSSAKERYNMGYNYAKNNIDLLTLNLKDGEGFNFVTHSMGAALAEGIAKYLHEKGYRIANILHINAFQAADITTLESSNTIDYQNTDDPVINMIPLYASPGRIKKADQYLRRFSDESLLYRHRWPIVNSKDFWRDLRNSTYHSWTYAY